MVQCDHLLQNNSHAILFQATRGWRLAGTHHIFRSMSSIQKQSAEKLPEKTNYQAPVKFTRSAAHLDYRATDNFYGGDAQGDLPKSHNFVIAFTGIFGVIYLILLRDDIEGDGGSNLFKPIYETVPDIAIPLIQSAIAENKRQGLNTKKLEKKLAEYMKEPEKHGLSKPKLVDN